MPSKVHAASLDFESFLTACNSSDASRGTKITKARVKLSGRLAVLKLNGRAELEEVEEVIQELLEALGSEVSFTLTFNSLTRVLRLLYSPKGYHCSLVSLKVSSAYRGTTAFLRLAANCRGALGCLRLRRRHNQQCPSIRKCLAGSLLGTRGDHKEGKDT